MNTIVGNGNIQLASPLAAGRIARYIRDMELRIERLGMEGDGIGRGPSGNVYVPFSLPGEVVRVEAFAERPGRAEILTASPHRVEPACPHFGACGGCALQHASDAFLANWKLGAVTRALAAHGISAAMRPVATAPARSRRRAVFAGRRTKKTVQIGFYRRNSDEIVPIRECQLIAPKLLAALPALEALTRIGASRTNAIRLNVTQSDTGLDVAVSDAKSLTQPLRAAAVDVSAIFDFARLSWNSEVVALARPPSHRLGHAIVKPPPGAFAQATPQGERALVDAVLEIVVSAKHIVDLFSGCGTFTLPLAERAEILAVEADAGMLAALDSGWRQAVGLKRVTPEIRDLFSRPLMAAELNRFDAAVLDPPRSGASAQCEQIAASNLATIAYVSCNPVSFARDAQILVASGFAIDWVQVVDQFRWSGHVELVARFVRQPMRP